MLKKKCPLRNSTPQCPRLRALESDKHLPSPGRVALNYYLAISGIPVFTSKARIPFPTPHTSVPPLTHVPWIQANSRTADPRPPAVLPKKLFRVRKKDKKIRLQKYESPLLPMPGGKRLPTGSGLGEAVKGRPHSRRVHTANLQTPVLYTQHSAWRRRVRAAWEKKQITEMAFQEGGKTRQPGASSAECPLLTGPRVAPARDGRWR